MILSRLVTAAALLALVGIVGVKVWPSAAESARVMVVGDGALHGVA